MKAYFNVLRQAIGQNYLMTFLLLVSAWHVLQLLRGKRTAGVFDYLFYGVWILVITPLYVGFLTVVGVPHGSFPLAYQLLPSIALAAIAFGKSGIVLEERFGRKAWLALVLVVALLASQPWSYTTSKIQITSFKQPKVDAEVVELSELMGEGLAYMPWDMAIQFREIQSETGVCLDGEYGKPEVESTTDLIHAIDAYGVNYVVCPREYDNPEWFGGYGFIPVGETTHYIVYHGV